MDADGVRRIDANADGGERTGRLVEGGDVAQCQRRRRWCTEDSIAAAAVGRRRRRRCLSAGHDENDNYAPARGLARAEFGVVPYVCFLYHPPRIAYNFSQPSDGVRSHFKVLDYAPEYGG